RYGHSQIRSRYRVNASAPAARIFPDLIGFRPITPDRRVEWTRLFDGPGVPLADRARKIDGRMVRALIGLPGLLAGEADVQEFHALAVRDLERGQRVGLPSGEAVAQHFGVTALTAQQIGAQAAGWTGETPLWYYILREADVHTGGDRLGPVGGRIVG